MCFFGAAGTAPIMTIFRPTEKPALPAKIFVVVFISRYSAFGATTFDLEKFHNSPLLSRLLFDM